MKTGAKIRNYAELLRIIVKGVAFQTMSGRKKCYTVQLSKKQEKAPRPSPVRNQLIKLSMCDNQALRAVAISMVDVDEIHAVGVISEVQLD